METAAVLLLAATAVRDGIRPTRVYYSMQLKLVGSAE